MLSGFIVMNKISARFFFFLGLLLSIGGGRVRVREEDEDRICRWAIYADEGERIWSRPFNLMLSLLS